MIAQGARCFAAPRCFAILSLSPWGYSSAGRALAWHARGQRFDPAYLHQSRCRRFERIVQVLTLSSRGLGHHPFTVSTGVRIPVGSPSFVVLGLRKQAKAATTRSGSSV